MKDYPSIPRSTGTNFRDIPSAHVFDKLDGSSLRSEFSRKRGWYKHGKRSGLVDDSNPHLAIAPALFNALLAEPLERIARDNRWDSLVVFYEFWGALSVAGSHCASDPKFLTVFDAAADRGGFIPPNDFRNIFEDKVPTPKYLGTVHWTRGYVEDVRLGKVDGITFEGVVAKAGSRHDIVRAKAKTQAWIDRVMEIHGANGANLVNS